MIRKKTPTFGKDLRHLSRRPSSARSRVLGHPSHWAAALFTAVAIGIWLGSSPDAAVERPSPTLKKQIELVLDQDPVPLSEIKTETETETETETKNGSGIDPMPVMESFAGVAAIEKAAPAFGAVLQSVDAAKITDDSATVEPATAVAGAEAELSESQDKPSVGTWATAESETTQSELPASAPSSAPWESIQIQSF